MALTTQTGIDATEKNIYQDFRPGSNKVLPNGQVLSEDAQILMDKSIVAKPLGVPAAEQIRIKNNSFRYRWVNRSGASGSWFMRQKAVGWQLATMEDVDPMSVELTNDNGEIRMFDTVLMKIPVERYQAAMKYNTLKALNLQRDKRFLTSKDGETPSTSVFSDEAVVSHSASEIDKSDGAGKYIKTFEPTEAELNAKMGTEKTGRK